MGLNYLVFFAQISLIQFAHIRLCPMGLQLLLSQSLSRIMVFLVRQVIQLILDLIPDELWILGFRGFLSSETILRIEILSSRLML